MSREILRDAIVYLPARVIPAVAGVLAIPILTRLLAPEAYGHYLLATTSLTLIAGLSISWLVSVTIRFNVVYGVAALFKTCRALLFAAMLLGAALWVLVAFVLGAPFNGWQFALIGVGWIVVHSAFEYFAGWLRARERPAWYGAALSWRAIIGLLAGVALLLMGYEGGDFVLLGAAVAMAAALVVMPIGVLKDAHADTGHRGSDIGKAPLGEVLRYGIPAALSNMVIIGLSLADRYVVKAHLGTEAVAIYGANYDLAEKTIFFVNSMLLLSSSVIGFRIFERDGAEKAAEFLSSLMRLYLIAAPSLVVGLAVLAPYIVAAWLPERYAEGTGVLPIVASGGLFVGIMHRYSLSLSFYKRTDLIMWCSVGALVINLVSCWLLIPATGLLGAAASTAIAYASWLLLIRIAASQYPVPRFPWKTLLRVACAAGVAAAVMYATIERLAPGAMTLLCAFVLGMAAYLATLLLLREFSAAQLMHAVANAGRRSPST